MMRSFVGGTLLGCLVGFVAAAFSSDPAGRSLAQFMAAALIGMLIVAYNAATSARKETE